MTGKKSMHESQVVGLMKVGSHFGNDLPQGAYNYQNKTICHLVARQPSAIGVIRHERLQELYASFPQWKEKVQLLNQLLFTRCER